MRWGAPLKVAIAALAVFPSYARATFGGQDYLPGTVHHLDQAKAALNAGQYELAMAHARLVVHDQGLRVFVDLSETPESLRSACLNAAQRGIQYWNDLLGAGSLTLVDSSREAELKIVFNKSVTLKGVQVGGYCSQSRSVAVDGGIATSVYNATIQARYQLPGGKNLNEECLVNIVTHEIGHVYGLNDCTDHDHLMSPLHPGRPKSSLHADEMEALKRLRLTAFEIQRTVQARSKGN